MILVLFACSESAISILDEGDDTAAGKDPVVEDTAAEDTGGDVEEPDYSEYDDATLVVLSPASGAFLPWGDPTEFAAEVHAADGSVMPFDDITWSSDIDSMWAITGSDVEDASLDVGTHAITAQAKLPNGDRLAYTIGGVLVQSPYTGVYSGDLSVTASGDYNGTPLSVGCSGALTVVIDAYGELATGDAGCLISLLGYDLDTTYAIELDNTDGDLEGQVALDLVITNYDIDSSGSVTEDGELDGSFSTDIFGYLTLDGSYEATRISRDVSAYE